MDTEKNGPKAKVNLVKALRELLENKDFNSITTAEIANTAQANEALIYRYFGNKRGLLHRVLDEYLNEALIQIQENLEELHDPLQKLRSIIKDTFEIYNQHRVFAKIILLEVRSFPGYFKSKTYQVVRRYARLYFDVIQEGINSGDIKDDIPPSYIRDGIIGALEHMVMPAVVFGKDMQPELFTEKLYQIFIQGIENKNENY